MSRGGNCRVSTSALGVKGAPVFIFPPNLSVFLIFWSGNWGTDQYDVGFMIHLTLVG